MTSRLRMLAAAGLSVVLLASTSSSLRSQQPAPATGDRSPMQMMAAMHANDQKLDALVKKMNAATGAAKVDAIAELLTALVDDRHAMHQSMQANMSTMMGMMQGRGDTSMPHTHPPQK